MWGRRHECLVGDGIDEDLGDGVGMDPRVDRQPAFHRGVGVQDGAVESRRNHVTGRRDGIVPISDSLALADRFADPVIIEHGGGHVIPDDPAITTRIVEFVAWHAAVTSSGLTPG